MACIAVYCSRELFPIPVTYVYIIYGMIKMMMSALEYLRILHVTNTQ